MPPFLEWVGVGAEAEPAEVEAGRPSWVPEIMGPATSTGVRDAGSGGGQVGCMGTDLVPALQAEVKPDAEAEARASPDGGDEGGSDIHSTTA